MSYQGAISHNSTDLVCTLGAGLFDSKPYVAATQLFSQHSASHELLIWQMTAPLNKTVNML